MLAILKQGGGKRTSLRNQLYSFVHIILLAFLILHNISSTQGRSLKRGRIKGLDSHSEDSENGQMDLISLLEDDLSHHDKTEFNSWPLKRAIRSSLDDGVDDDEESLEDEDVEDGDGNDDSPKHKVKEKVELHTTPPSSLQLKPPSSQASSPSSTSAVPSSTAKIPTPAIRNETHGKVNGTGRALPHGTVQGRPPTAPGGGAGPGGRGEAGRPGGPGGPGHMPIPPHGKPGGGFPFPGKLPPHLLKHIPTPRPPAKKGELYLPEDYNNLVIPKLNLGKLIGIDSYSAVPVLVFLNIRSVRDIDETLETLTLDLDLVIEWVDGFLFDPISAITVRQADITLNPIFLKKIWRPDIYIDEVVKVKRTSLMNKPLKLKFNPSNGFISYTTRLTVQLSCDMIYKYYPADTHRCEFTFRSYSYFSKDLELSWLGTGVYLQDPSDPNFDLQVESIDRIKLPQTFRKLTNDTYDGLTFTILARRKLSFHLVQTYLPSIFFIVITWLCFLVPSRMVEARIGISMTTLLTLTSMFASVRESTPIVSYVKAIDIWIVFCIFFVFLTLLEFATLVWLRSRREDAEEQKLEQQRKMQEKRSGGEKEFGTGFTRSPSLESTKLRQYEKFAEITEKYAFFIFSVVFTIFNIVYWSWLLVTSDYFGWSVNGTLNADLD